jgi:hypothetical protein
MQNDWEMLREKLALETQRFRRPDATGADDEPSQRARTHD